VNRLVCRLSFEGWNHHGQYDWGNRHSNINITCLYRHPIDPRPIGTTLDTMGRREVRFSETAHAVSRQVASIALHRRITLGTCIIFSSRPACCMEPGQRQIKMSPSKLSLCCASEIACVRADTSEGIGLLHTRILKTKVDDSWRP
jgi:hypothetical protein